MGLGGTGRRAQRTTRKPGRARDQAAVALAVLSGATDAIGFVALGGAFTSVMTGNMVLLGIGAARPDGSLAGNAAAAIVCFVLGCAVGTRVAGTARDGDRTWPWQVTRALVVEAAILLCYALLWWTAGSAPGPRLQLGLLVMNALALGIQSSTIQRFGVAGLSTTYMTGTLTTMIVKLTSGRGAREVAHSSRLLLGLVAGAAIATYLVTRWPVLGPVPQLAALAVALALAMAVRRTQPSAGAEAGVAVT